MTRSLWKGPFFDYSLVRNEDLNSLTSAKIPLKRNQLKGIKKIWSRRSVILPHFIERRFEIHNGKEFINLKVSEEMIGHKFGEFALTRKKPRHVIPRGNIKSKTSK